MRAVRNSIVMTLVLVAQASAQVPAAGAAATITPQDVQQRIDYLASDALGGRDTPSPGLELAAEYIAREFKAYGLKPGGDGGSYIQRWPFRQTKLDVAALTAQLRGTSTRELVHASEYFLIPAPNVDSLSGALVYGGTAAAGAAPQSGFASNVVAMYIAGTEMDQAWLQSLQAGFIAALSGGATAAVFILDPQFDAADISNVVTNVAGAQVPLPLMGVRYDVARDWLKTQNLDLDSLRAAALAKPLEGLSILVRSPLAGTDTKAPNVVGILEGSDPELKHTYVVYTAHMDHVGTGAPDAEGDSIYNGADDDASGTSAVMEIAQAFAGMPERPKRSLMFVLVSGEEKGLFGSAYFVQNPPVPATQMIANINIDMIGRNAPDSTVAIGQDYSTLGPIMQNVVRAHPELKLTVAPDLWPEENLFMRSDHYSFAKAKIPAIFFTSGLHKDYHQPSDEPETIDADKLVRTARLLFFLGHDLANSPVAPVWTQAGLEVIRAN